MIKEKKEQGVFCKTVVDSSPDDHRRVAATVLAVSALPRPPWPRSPSLPCLCSRGAAEESSYAAPRLDFPPASPWRARRRRPNWPSSLLPNTPRLAEIF